MYKHFYFYFGFAGWGKKFHEAVKKLDSINNSLSYSGITFGDKSYDLLLNQSEIEYTYLNSYEELYKKFRNTPYTKERIKKLDDTYGSLWKFAYADRQLVTYHHPAKYADYDLGQNDVLNIIQGIFDYYESLVEKGVDCFITYARAAAWHEIAAAVAKKHGLGFYTIQTTRYPDRHFIKDIELDAMVRFSMPDKEDHEKAELLLESFEKKQSQPSWLQNNQRSINKRSKFKIDKIQSFLESYNRSSKDFNISVHDPGNLMPSVGLRLKEWIKFKYRFHRINKSTQKYFHTISNFEDSKYIYFPLHVEPEAATMVLAPYYINQIALIENLSKSIPADHTIFVKDHPNMLGTRPLDFYTRLKRIPNVKLLEPSISSMELINHAALVVVITGTAGWEAALLRKKVITFGKVFFNKLEGVHPFSGDVTELPNFIRMVLKTEKPSREDRVNFLADVIANSFEISASQAWNSGAEIDYSEISTVIFKLINDVILNR